MPIASDFTSILSKKRKIDFTQCLPNGNLKYTDLCNILQLVAGDHAELGGISFSDMQQHNQAWVLSRMRVEIEELPKWKDKVTVKTWIVNLENSRSVRALEMYLGERRIIGCETFWAVFNTNSRRPEALALPHGHFEKFNKHFSTVDRVKRVDLPVDMKAIATHTVKVSDLDIVNHVNNVKYLEWCLDAAGAEITLDKKIRSLDMNFIKELVLEDSVDISTASTEDFLLYAVEKDGKTCFALEIK
jgi:acyl-ACP thioesterase